MTGSKRDLSAQQMHAWVVEGVHSSCLGRRQQSYGGVEGAGFVFDLRRLERALRTTRGLRRQ